MSQTVAADVRQIAINTIRFLARSTARSTRFAADWATGQPWPSGIQPIKALSKWENWTEEDEMEWQRQHLISKLLN